MRPWLVLLLVALALAPTARADPAITMPGPGLGRAVWTFSNPANYSLSNASLGTGEASLAWDQRFAGDTAETDFAAAQTLLNVDVHGSPGDVLIANLTGQGPPQTLVFQPDPAAMVDNYLYLNKQNLNFGTAPDLFVGNWGGSEWTRSLLRFPSFPIPSNATLTSVELSLYMHTADTPNPMDISVHRVVTSWTELGSTWNSYDGVHLWNTSGGDFDPAPVATVAGVAATLGWYSWNITTLARGWWSGSIPNQGLLVRQADDTITPNGRKQFYSSDATNASARPYLTIAYTTPWAVGVLESRIFDAGGASSWGTSWWNASLAAGSALTMETRSGDAPSIDATWSPWSRAYVASGRFIVSPVGRYLEYRAILTATASQSPRLSDVSFAFSRYAASGVVVTEALATTGLVGWGLLEANWTGPPGTQTILSFSQDNGSSWAPAASGQNLSSALPTAVRLRVSLATANTTMTPRLSSLSLEFTLPAYGGPGTPAAGPPWWLFLLSLMALPVWLVLRRTLRTPFRATDLFLIHADGRLVARVGGAESPLNDELAASGMFTVVARFVRDSFGDPSGARGELKSLRVDEREVAITKGDYLFLALVGTGAPPRSLEGSMHGFLADLETRYRPVLGAWDGLRTSLGDLQDRLRAFLEAQRG